MPEKIFLARLSTTDRMRVQIDLERGQVLGFVIQYETWHDGEYLPVVRYDTSHDHPHQDTLDRDGRQIAKEWLPETWTIAECLTYAQQDLRSNWEQYRERFMRKET